jgi:hypothetical protein
VAARKERSENVATLSLPGQNHFSILGDLADPDGIHMSTVAEAIAPAGNT